MNDDNDNVRSMPLESSAVLRHGLEAFLRYLETSAPKPPDPHVAELALFDQVVVMQLSYQRTTDEAIAAAVAVITARRALSSLGEEHESPRDRLG